MLTTIEGIYENGHVVFNENPPTISKSKVLVTFIGEISNKTPFKKRPFGTLKGTIKLSDDFNEPLDELKDYM
jgi:Protein of unknown function (DUF2281)